MRHNRAANVIPRDRVSVLSAAGCFEEARRHRTAAKGECIGEFESGRPEPFSWWSLRDALRGRQPLSASILSGRPSYPPGAVMDPFLAGLPAQSPIWPGDWPKGIEYVVDGPDGTPLFADFHALRHSFIALLERTGASVREAMQLARHSDPKLTMAVYGKKRLHDLGTAVGRLPDLSASREKAYRPLTGPVREYGVRMMVDECEGGVVMGNGEKSQTLDSMGFAASCGRLMEEVGSSPRRTRTFNKPINSRLLYH